MKNINRHVITGAIITDYEEMLQRLKNYLTIEALENGLTASLSTNACQYSTDGVTWTDLPAGTTTPAINTGEKLYFKATGLTPSSSAGIGTFTVSKQFNLSGNCMSMLFGDEAESNFDLTGYNYAFYGLFRNCTTLKSVSAEFLPATTLATYCYYSMFSGCTGLTTAPELPATTLSNQCYNSMFYGCTGLTTAPELPATTLATYCYFSMFRDCTGLTTAPEILPATKLATYCYYSMFSGCTGLTTAPELPATTLSNQCYNSMFYGCTGLTTAPELPATRMVHWCYTYMFTGCTSLTAAPELPATTLADACYKSMFSGCTALTTAPEILPATTLTLTCYEYMFYGCTGLTTAPELPATTLTISCYEYMFSGCTALTTAPALPATTLTISCYNGMFKNCTALTTAPALPATTLANDCYNSMFFGTNVLPDCTNIDFSSSTVVSSGGLKGLFWGTKVTDSYLRSILPINPDTGNYWLPATTLANYCYEYMFSGCTALTTAPELPATTLNNWCYYYMFQGCTGLTTAPELPATTLEYECYYHMFEGCTKLNYIKMLATNISATRCLYNWVSGVASTGTFVKNIDATWDVTGVNGIPTGWEVQINITPIRCISLSITADDVSGRSTNTTIYWTAEVEGVDDKENTLIITYTGTDTSESFPQNTSTTDTIERTISYTYMGVTATTTITQGIWVDAGYTVNLNNQWQSSSVVNPDSSLYDGVYESFSNKGVHNTAAIMYIDINGYNNFDLYIRSYAESSYDYVMVSQLDQTISNSTSYSNTTLIKAHTRGTQKSGTSIDNYTKVSFTGIDGGQHRITIVYRKDSSSNSGDDRGYVLIPKNQ